MIMELQVLLWILAGGFTGTWGLCLFFMNRADTAVQDMRREVQEEIHEIRKEITQIYQWQREIQALMTEHSCRIKVLETPKS